MEVSLYSHIDFASTQYRLNGAGRNVQFEGWARSAAGLSACGVSPTKMELLVSAQ